MALTKQYNPLRWYWAVAGSTTQVWSSQNLSYLPVSNGTYAAWAVNNIPTPIASAGALIQVMYAQVEPYILSLGATVNSTGTPSINAIYGMDTASMNRLSIITSMLSNNKPLPSGTTTFSYPDVTGNLHTFTSTNIINLASALQTWRYQWETAVATLVTGGSASLPGTITIA